MVCGKELFGIWYGTVACSYNDYEGTAGCGHGAGVWYLARYCLVWYGMVWQAMGMVCGRDGISCGTFQKKFCLENCMGIFISKIVLEGPRAGNGIMRYIVWCGPVWSGVVISPLPRWDVMIFSSCSLHSWQALSLVQVRYCQARFRACPSKGVSLNAPDAAQDVIVLLHWFWCFKVGAHDGG